MRASVLDTFRRNQRTDSEDRRYYRNSGIGETCHRSVVRQIEADGGDRDAAPLDHRDVGIVSRRLVVALRPDPEIGASARIEPLS